MFTSNSTRSSNGFVQTCVRRGRGLLACAGLASVRFAVLAACVALGVMLTRSAHAQPSQILGTFQELDDSFLSFDPNGVIPSNPGTQTISGNRIVVDRNGDGRVNQSNGSFPIDPTFDLPVGARGAVQYRLSPSRGFLLVRGAADFQGGCAGAGNAVSLGVYTVPAVGVVPQTLTLVHEECFPQGTDNSRFWYDTGRCGSQGSGCTTPATEALGINGQRVFVVLTQTGINQPQLHLWDLTRPGAAGRVVVDSGDGLQFMVDAMRVSRGGDYLFVQHDIPTGSPTADYMLIDLCPSAARFGDVLTGPGFPLNDIGGGFVQANMTDTGAGSGMVNIAAVQVGNVIADLTAPVCTAGSAAPLGRCCNPMTGGCTVTTLANCAGGPARWTANIDCSQPCPQPTAVLALNGSAPASVVAGERFSYSLTVTNSGFLAANNVVVTCFPPFATTFVSASDNAVVVPPGQTNAGRVTWTLGSIAPMSQRTVTMTVEAQCLLSQPIVLNPSQYRLTATGVFGLNGAPAVSTTVTDASRDPVLLTVTSTPDGPLPMRPNNTMTNTIRIENPSNVDRTAIRLLGLRAGNAMYFDAVLADGGGTVTGLGTFFLDWSVNIPANSFRELVVRSRVFPCIFPASQTQTGLSSGQTIFVYNACSFGIAQAPAPAPVALSNLVALGLSASGPPGQVTPSPNSGLVLIRPGATADFTVTLTNLFADPVADGLFTVVIPVGLTVNNPPFVGAVPAGVSYDEPSRTITFAGPLAANQTVALTFAATTPTTGGCAQIDVTGGTALCQNLTQSKRLAIVPTPPSVPHLVGVDYIDGLWTFTPGVDTDFQPLLCMDNRGSSGLARSAAGDIYLVVPPIRFNPISLELEDIPTAFIDGADIAFDETTGTVVICSGNGTLKRYDPVTHIVTTVLTNPALGFARRVVVGVDGRIAAIFNQELHIIDPSAGSVTPIAMPAAMYPTGLGTAQSFGVTSLAVDGAGNYVVTSRQTPPNSFSSATALVKIDGVTLATTVLENAVDGPPESDPLALQGFPNIALAVGEMGEVYGGTVIPDRLGRVDLSPPAAAAFYTEVRTTFDSGLGSLDMVHTNPGVVGGGGTVPCAADFNRDGNLDPDDLADYIGAYFSQPPAAAADFNRDGLVDPDDLADYIGAFFAGC